MAGPFGASAWLPQLYATLGAIWIADEGAQIFGCQGFVRNCCKAGDQSRVCAESAAPSLTPA